MGGFQVARPTMFAADIQPPQSNPSQMLQTFMAMRNANLQYQGMQQEQQMRALQIQEGQIGQQSRRALVNKINSSDDPASLGLDDLVKAGVQPEEADAFLKAQAQHKQNVAQQDASTRSALAAVDEEAAGQAQAVRNIDPSTTAGQARRQKQYETARQNMRDYVNAQNSFSRLR